MRILYHDGRLSEMQKSHFMTSFPSDVTQTAKVICSIILIGILRTPLLKIRNFGLLRLMQNVNECFTRENAQFSSFYLAARV